MPSPEQKEYLRMLAGKYRRALRDSPNVQEILSARGIDVETANSSGLGIVHDQPKEHYHLRGCLSIPYITPTGVVNMRFRCMEDHTCKDIPDHPKYQALPDGGVNLYNVTAVEAYADSDWIVVCEGELDAIILDKLGIPAIGIPGAENFKDHWVRCFADFTQVFVIGDSDGAGRKMVGKWKDQFKAKGRKGVVRGITLPDGEDVTDSYLSRGGEFLTNKIKG